jgi:hypothetical protein
MNKSKRLRLERQAIKSYKLLKEERMNQLRRELLYEDIRQIGQEVDKELKQTVVV